MKTLTKNSQALLILILLLIAGNSCYAQNLKISAGENYTLVTCNNGQVYGIGDNSNGQMGLDQNLNPRNFGNYFGNFERLHGFPQAIKMADAGSASHGLAIDCNDCVLSWGANFSGQLGIGSNIDNATPTYVYGVSGNPQLCGVKSVSGGTGFSYAVMNDGRLASWGDNANSQLGVGSNGGYNSIPDYVVDGTQGNNTPLSNVLMVEAGDVMGFALVDNGNGLGMVYSWGGVNAPVYHPYAGRNDNPATELYTAKPVVDANGNPLTDIKTISSGDGHGLAVDKSGNVWAWGGNWYGQKGDGGTNEPLYATKVVGGQSGETFLGDNDPIISIAAGRSHSVAVTASGKVYTWGNNANGQLGNPGAGAFSTSPVMALDQNGNHITNATDVSDGDETSIVVTQDGKVMIVGTGFNATNFAEVTMPCELDVPCPVVDLGPDRTVCPSEYPLTYSSPALSAGFTVEWYRDGNLQNTVTLTANGIETRLVNGPGKYKMRIVDNRPASDRPCDPCMVTEDQVVITENQSTLNPDTIKFCQGDIDLSINGGTGTFLWYRDATTPTVLATTIDGGVAQINPTLLNLTGNQPNRNGFVYVENFEVKQAKLGPQTQPCTTNEQQTFGSGLTGGVWQKITIYGDVIINSLSTEIGGVWTNGSYPVNVVVREDNGGGLGNVATSGSSNIAITTGNAQNFDLTNLNIQLTGTSNGKSYWLQVEPPASGYVIEHRCDANNGVYSTTIDGNIIGETHSDFISYGTLNNTGMLSAWNIDLEQRVYNGCERVPVPIKEVCQCQLPPFDAGSLITSCYGDTVQLDAIGQISAAYRMEWIKPSNWVKFSNVFDPKSKVWRLPTGKMFLKWEITDMNDLTCKGIDSVEIYVGGGMYAEPIVHDETCFNAKDGTVDLVPLGGMGNVTAVWKDGTVTYNRTDLGKGTYTIQMTDSLGCYTEQDVIVNGPDSVAIDSVVTQPSCQNPNGGAIDITLFGPFVNPQFLWSNGATTEDLTGLSAGTYKLEVRHDPNCLDTISFTLTAPGSLSLSLDATHPSCYQSNDGAIDLTIVQGAAPFVYQWSNGANTEDVNGLDSNRYTVTVTDDNGCTATLDTLLTHPDSVDLNPNVQQILCYGKATGFIELAPVGGTPGYTYQWSNGGQTNRIDNLTPGNYKVNVVDANNCKDSIEITILDGAPLFIDSIVTQPSCGLNNGSIHVMPPMFTPGLPPIYTSYQWAHGPDTNFIENLAPGTYTVTISSDVGCDSTFSFTLIDDPGFKVQGKTIVHPSCHDTNDGRIETEIIGAPDTYTYAWNNGVVTPDINALDGGVYQLIVTNPIGCKDTLDVTLVAPDTLKLMVDVSNPLCYQSADGEIDLTVINGIAPFTYQWNNGATIEDINGLDSSRYTVTVTDDNGCIATLDTLLTHPDSVDLNPNVQQILCYGKATGFIELAPVGGTPGYTYQWSNGGQTNRIDNLTPGNYKANVVDANNCKDSIEITILDGAPLFIDSIVTQPSCGLNNGSIHVMPPMFTPGLPPIYTSYQWAHGPDTNFIENLAPGTYTVTISSDVGCDSTFSFTLINDPGFKVQTKTITNPICHNSNDGLIETEIVGPPDVYNYVWSNGGTTPDINNLGGGVYQLIVTNPVGCKDTVDVELVAPDSMKLSIQALSPSCFNSNNGSIDLTITGGTPPYQVSWSNGATTEDLNGLGAGYYEVEVIDVNGFGCVAKTDTTLINPAPIQIDTTVVHPSCFGSLDGSITSIVTGGSGVFTYQWNRGDQIKDLFNAWAGTYKLNVEDDKGCKDSVEVTLVDPEELKLSVSNDTTVCLNATVVLKSTANGGAAPYSYQWDNGKATQNITEQITANQKFLVTVTDGKGCRVEDSVKVVLKALNSFVDAGRDLAMCQGEQVQFEGGTNLPHVLWVPSIGVSDTNNPKAFAAPNVDMEYILAGIDECGNMVSDTMQVKVNVKPEISIVSDKRTGCVPQCFELRNNAENKTNAIFKWFVNGEEKSDSMIFNYCSDKSGVFDIKLQLEENGCVAESEVLSFLEVYPLPIADFDYSPKEVTTDVGLVTFTDISTGADFHNWQLSTGDSLLSYSQSSFEYEFTKGGNKVVSLLVKNRFGCEDSISKTFYVEPVNRLFVPNAFTPTGNGLNDVFKPVLFGYDDAEYYEFLIFNRWGEQIFQTFDKNQAWDGTYKNNPVQVDVYVWKVIVKATPNAKQESFVGHVSVIR